MRKTSGIAVRATSGRTLRVDPAPDVLGLMHTERFVSASGIPVGCIMFTPTGWRWSTREADAVSTWTESAPADGELDALAHILAVV